MSGRRDLAMSETERVLAVIVLVQNRKAALPLATSKPEWWPSSGRSNAGFESHYGISIALVTEPILP